MVLVTLSLYTYGTVNKCASTNYDEVVNPAYQEVAHNCAHLAVGIQSGISVVWLNKLDLVYGTNKHRNRG